MADFLSSACEEPSALIIAGEPGVGKTSLWSSAVARAHERGFRVLPARGAEAESVFAYSALADQLVGIDKELAYLAPPQRHAIERIMLRAKADAAAVDEHAVSAGFVSIVQRLAEHSPVLLAVDDSQWLDPSSARVLAFAVRRAVGRVGILTAVRGDADGVTSWLQMAEPESITRIALHPLSLGALNALIPDRLGRPLSRPTMTRIYEVSAGNPFYALELAYAIRAAPPGSDPPLPRTLAEIVRSRIGSLDDEAREALLAAACLADPTISWVSEAIGIHQDQLAEVLAEAEARAIVEFDGNRVRFTHPLLAAGVYADAAPAQRRRMHRRLGGIVDHAELRARHMALGATSLDPRTLDALDAAAECARNRGAPAAAAELLELALRLGGDTPARRMRLAAHHFDSGDSTRAQSLLQETIEQLEPGTLRAEALSGLAIMRLVEDSSLEAATLLQQALSESDDDLGVQVRALIPLSYALGESGRLGAAVDAAEDAVSRATQLGQPELLSQALGLRVMLNFMRGDVVDEASLRRALELENRDASVPMPLRPSLHNALILAWTGQLERGRDELLHIRRGCLERGDESDLIYITFHAVLLELWRGDLGEAMLLAEDAVERAMQLGGDVSLFVALTIRAAAAAYGGREEDARRDLAEALAASRRCGSFRLAEWPITIVGFLEVSLGNYRAALTTLEPLLSHLDVAPDATEIVGASFVPDAIEAMIHVGRLSEAESLIDRLERNGRRHDRAWMLAVAARSRAMLAAAQGDLDAALDAAEQAMVEHKRLPMPFERARTQLLLGQIQRRQRQKLSATATLSEALRTFEGLHMPLWADRARSDIDRSTVAPSDHDNALTPSEQRVAELAAAGMTNREIAATVFISSKTVEVNLYRVYRKLGIRSRNQLTRPPNLQPDS